MKKSDMKKIIFLDIDGVLNSQDFLLHRSKIENNDLFKYLESMIDEKAVLVLEYLCNITKAEIVVSSTWRLNHYINLKAILYLKGLNAIVIDKTPRQECCRGCEIHQWIRDNISYLEVDSASNFKNYLILDDDSDMLLQQKNNFVHVNNEFGLTKKYIKKSLKILDKKI